MMGEMGLMGIEIGKQVKLKQKQQLTKYPVIPIIDC